MNETVVKGLQEIVKDLVKCNKKLSTESFRLGSNIEATWLRFKIDESDRVVVSISYDNIELRSNVLLDIAAWKEIVDNDDLFKTEIEYIIKSFHVALLGINNAIGNIADVA